MKKQGTCEAITNQVCTVAVIIERWVGRRAKLKMAGTDRSVPERKKEIRAQIKCQINGRSKTN